MGDLNRDRPDDANVSRGAPRHGLSSYEQQARHLRLSFRAAPVNGRPPCLRGPRASLCFHDNEVRRPRITRLRGRTLQLTSLPSTGRMQR